MLYPQNGDSFVTIDSVTQLHTMYSQQRSFLIIHQEAIDRYRRSEGYTTDEMRLPSNATLRLLWKLFEYPDTTDDVTMETCYYCHQLTVSVLFLPFLTV